MMGLKRDSDLLYWAISFFTIDSLIVPISLGKIRLDHNLKQQTIENMELEDLKYEISIDQAW